MRRSAILIFGLLMVSCGGGGNDGGSGTSQSPADATTLESKVKALGIKHVRKIVVLESSLLSVFVPGSPLSQSVSVTPSATPGAYTIGGSYDGNLDGVAETSLSGTASFSEDPDFEWSGMTGQVTANVDLLNLMHVYHADLAFSIGSDERRFSGTSRYTEPVGGDTTTLSVAASAPLVVKPAGAGVMANVCGYSVTGDLNVAIDGLLGRYAGIWRFLTSSSTVAITGASYTDKSGQTTTLPDASVDLRCGTNVADWVGTFELDWVCLPREYGNWRMRFSVKDDSTLTITDADDGDSFDATIVGVSAHALKGYFMAGPVGSRYREDFIWTLASHGNEFTQVTKYIFQEGARQGRGGICVGRAKRVS